MKCRQKLTNQRRTNRNAVDETVNWLMNSHKSQQTKQGVRESDKHSIYNEDTTFVRTSSAKFTRIPQEMNLQYAVYVILILATQLPQLSGLNIELPSIFYVL
jgi:hypothetical protein